MPEEMKTIVKIYEDVVCELCQFYTKMEIDDDPMKVFEVFWYMCVNSYLSSGQFFNGIPESIINLEKKNIIFMDIEGSVILADYGVCRNTTDFLSHIYAGLGYDSSQLFLYSPNMETRYYLKSTSVTIEELRRCVDDAKSNVDPYSKESIHLVREYDKVKVVVNYRPTEDPPNHTVNIVKSKREKRIYIVDMQHHRVGSVIDETMLLSSDLIFNYTDYVISRVNYDTYYDKTDYDWGFFLLNEYDTRFKQDLLASSLYRDDAPKLASEYRAFKLKNKEKYDTIKNEYQKLIKKIG